MRKFFFLAFAAVLLLGVGPCGGSSGGGGSGDDDNAGDDDATDDDTMGDVWTDTTSGLTWQVTPTSDDLTWEEAKAYCDNLSLDGHDDWRLPTISELRGLIRGCDATVTGGSCGVTDSCLYLSCNDESCYSCNSGAGPNDGCYGPPELPGECDPGEERDVYWSSSPVANGGYGGDAWCVNFCFGSLGWDGPVDAGYDVNPARCVRP
jgi:hypothetical protein